MALEVSKRLITAEEYHKMGEAGILSGKGIELINGEIIEMSPIGSRHAALVDKLNRLLSKNLPEDLIVRIQNPIRIDDYSEPEPDISIVLFRDDYYQNQLPEGKDTLLIIEVADSSVDYDRLIKLPLYASAGIPEYWVINLEQNEVEAYWQPVGGAYKFRELLLPGEYVKARRFELSISVGQILG